MDRTNVYKPVMFMESDAIAIALSSGFPLLLSKERRGSFLFSLCVSKSTCRAIYDILEKINFVIIVYKTSA